MDIYHHTGYSNGYLIVMQAGDWMNYTADVAQTGTYTLQAKVAWGDAVGGTFHVEVDGVDKTGSLQIPNTGWGTQTITKTGVAMTAGRHVLKVVAETNASNGCTGDIDNLVFVAEGTGGGTKLTAVGVTASASHPTAGPQYATDGNLSSAWVVDGFAPQWIQLDLGQSANLSQVRLSVQQDPAGQTVHEVWGGATPSSLTLLGTLSGYTQSGQWLELTTAAQNVRYVRVVTTGSPSWVGWNEVEVYGSASAAQSGSASGVQWLISDQLGTPRMVIDQSGALSGVKRHDYLPFGEEVGAGVGGRTTQQGYGQLDGNRKKWAQLERDDETGLDYAEARYYSSMQGRFTSPDEFTGGPDELYNFVDDASANPTFYADLTKPQSLNKYHYSYNNPLRYVDPDGHEADDPQEILPVPILPPPLPVAGSPSTQGPPTPAQIWDALQRDFFQPIIRVPVVATFRQIIGRDPAVSPNDIETPTMPPLLPVPLPQPQTIAPPNTGAQPMPPPPPTEARHRKGKRGSTSDKHTNPRPGRPTTKDRLNPKWRPRQKPTDWPKNVPWPPWKQPEGMPPPKGIK